MNTELTVKEKSELLQTKISNALNTEQLAYLEKAKEELREWARINGRAGVIVMTLVASELLETIKDIN